MRPETALFKFHPMAVAVSFHTGRFITEKTRECCRGLYCTFFLSFMKLYSHVKIAELVTGHIVLSACAVTDSLSGRFLQFYYLCCQASAAGRSVAGNSAGKHCMDDSNRFIAGASLFWTPCLFYHSRNK
jgi:hypothetical protein